MSFIGDLTNLILGVSGVLKDVEDTITEGRQLVENIRNEVTHLKKFKIDPKWKNRVINVPTAVEKTHDFVLSIAERVQNDLHSLITNLRAIHFVGEVEHASGQLGGTGQGSGVLKILEDINKIRSVILEIKSFFLAANNFVTDLREIREELETFDTLFLGQGNLRKSVRLDGGGSIRVRLGKLHEDEF